MDLRTNIIERLRPFAHHYCGDELASLMAIASNNNDAPTSAQEAFDGEYGLALDKSFARLGWGYGSLDTRVWMGVLLDPQGQSALTATQLLKLCETLDPLTIVTLDPTSHEAITAAYSQLAPNLASAFPLGSQTSVLGRNLVSVDGFERALRDEAQKQRLWAQLKMAAFPKPLTRTRS